MKALSILILTLISFSISAISQPTSAYKFKLDKFKATMKSLHDSLGKKYEIRELVFTYESVKGRADLTSLVKKILALGDFKPVEIRDGHDTIRNQFYTIVKLNNKLYTFRASASEPSADPELFFPALFEIPLDNRIGYLFSFSNYKEGYEHRLIFAKIDKLLKAVNEGYPSNGAEGPWKLKKEWEWDTYFSIHLPKVPAPSAVREKYHQTLMELYNKGLKVPPLNYQRIYLDNIFNQDEYNIIIDGNAPYRETGEIYDNAVRCSCTPYSLVLAYTLVKHFNGKPIPSKNSQKLSNISSAEFFNKAEITFGSNIRK
jgi:hypothetical protein